MGQNISPHSTVIFLSLSVISLFLNSLGIYCLRRRKFCMKTQRIILLNLSSIEIIISLYMIIIVGGRYIDLTPKQIKLAHQIQIVLYHWMTILFYIAMIFISTDRLIGTVLAVKYNYYMHVSIVKRLILGMWIFSFITTFPFVFLVDRNVHKKVILYTSYSLQGIFVLVTITTYLSVYAKMRERITKFSMPNNGPKGLHQSQSQNLVPFLIIISFIICYQIPHYIVPITKVGKLVRKAVTFVGLIVDPVIYIFLNKSLRKYAFEFLRCCRKRSEDRSRTTTIGDVGEFADTLV